MAQTSGLTIEHDQPSRVRLLWRGGTRFLVLLTAILFLLTGLYKLQDVASFATLLRAQGVVPAASVTQVAWMVGFAEVLVGMVALWSVMQAKSVWLRSGAVVCSLLFFAFAVYAIALVISPPPSPTGCGCIPGSQAVASWGPIALRNGLLASLLSVMGAIA